jgi:hypothetical protein
MTPCGQLDTETDTCLLYRLSHVPRLVSKLSLIIVILLMDYSLECFCCRSKVKYVIHLFSMIISATVFCLSFFFSHNCLFYLQKKINLLV